MRVVRTELELESIVRRIRDGELDLQPDFQRDEIWDTPRRQRLIDTILRGWYVPAIHIVVDSEGHEVVLDGQQRLAAVRDFFLDKVRINGSTEPADPQIRSLDGLRYSTLPEPDRRAINRFALAVVTLVDYEPQEPNELFFRLNQSYNLTPPEKRNALHGEARDQVRKLVESLAEADLLNREHIGFNNARLAYDDIVARTCVAIELGDMTRHINNDVVENQYRRGPFATETIDTVQRAGTALKDLIDASPSRIKFNKGTLQTWLVYCAWAPIDTGPLPGTMLGQFEEARQRAKSGELPSGITSVLAMYDDRASYRVTDVSSVLIRDLAVHLFSQSEFGTPQKRESGELLARLTDFAGSSAQSMMADYLQVSRWGDPIVDGGQI